MEKILTVYQYLIYNGNKLDKNNIIKVNKNIIIF